MSEQKTERIEQGEMLLTFCVRLEWKTRTQNRKAKQPLPRLQPPNPRLHTPFRTRISQGKHDQHSSFPPRPARSNTLELDSKPIHSKQPYTHDQALCRNSKDPRSRAYKWPRMSLPLAHFRLTEKRKKNSSRLCLLFCDCRMWRRIPKIYRFRKRIFLYFREPYIIV